MPIKVQKDLPARAILEAENIFVMDEERALGQDIRPLEIVILNLMPLKEETETQLLRILSNSPLQVNVTFLMLSTHEARHTSANHLNQFYVEFSEIRGRRFDGMIITGAPVEQLPFEEVDYWPELCTIMDWTTTHVTSTIHICWGAQAGIYYHYGVPKYDLPKKLSGVYEHRLLHRRVPLVRSFDDRFLAPHSRYTTVRREDVAACEDLEILAESDEAGVYLVQSHDGRRVFIFGHPEYDRVTLDQEYRRDLAKGIGPSIPVRYYENDDPDTRPLLSWRSHSGLLYSNWLNYYVYQETPYEL